MEVPSKELTRDYVRNTGKGEGGDHRTLDWGGLICNNWTYKPKTSYFFSSFANKSLICAWSPQYLNCRALGLHLSNVGVRGLTSADRGRVNTTKNYMR